MKKCPKCGTILDDAKKKCYMCGADIQKKPQIDFMNGFDDQIGAAVTKGQDNVFNKVPDISVKVNDVVKNNSNNATFSSGSKSADFFKNQVGGSNGFHDDRTAIEKMFSSDSRYKPKDTFNVNNTNENKKSANAFSGSDFFNSTNNSNHITKKDILPTPIVTTNNQVNTQNNNVPAPKPKKEKPAINWGNNLLKNANNDVSSYKDNATKKLNVNFNFIFNTVCFVVFLIGFIFIYFKFIRGDGGTVSLGGLNYSINKEFKLKSDENSSKYYAYGENCVVRISYGNAVNVDSFENDYFEDVQNTYKTEDGFITQQNSMKVNDNTWSEIIVSELQENPASAGGYSTVSKYRFVTIVYKGNFYEIRYVNLNDDATCSSMYDDLVESLEFD